MTSRIPLFSIGGLLSLLVISPDFSLDLACAYSTFKYVAGRDNTLNNYILILCRHILGIKKDELIKLFRLDTLMLYNFI